MAKGIAKFMQTIMDRPTSKNVEVRGKTDTAPLGINAAREIGVPDEVYLKYLRHLFKKQELDYEKRNPRQSVHPGTENKPREILPLSNRNAITSQDPGEPLSVILNYLEDRDAEKYKNYDPRKATREEELARILEMRKKDYAITRMSKSPLTKRGYENEAFPTWAQMMSSPDKSLLNYSDLEELSPGKFRINPVKEQMMQDNQEALSRYYRQINMHPELGIEIDRILRNPKIMRNPKK